MPQKKQYVVSLETGVKIDGVGLGDRIEITDLPIDFSCLLDSSGSTSERVTVACERPNLNQRDRLILSAGLHSALRVVLSSN